MRSASRAAGIMAAECLCFRARKIARTLTRLYDEALRPLGLHATQLTLLNAVALHEPAGAPMKRLIDILALDQTTLSRNLRPLASAGLLRLERVASDRRVRLVRLTPDGARKVAAALPCWEAAHARVVATLGESAAAELRAGFDAASAAACP